MARKPVVKAKQRNERVDYNVYSTLVGMKPQDTNITCWCPHEEALKILKKYNALLARYSKMRKKQQASDTVYSVATNDLTGLSIHSSFLCIEKANQYKVELAKTEDFGQNQPFIITSMLK